MTDENIQQHEFIFLRHGESEGNVQGVYQGQHDFPLTENGKKQAQKLVERWQAEDVKFDRIITSPLLRASQTANLIGETLGVPVEEDAVWMERHSGRLAGVNHDEAEVVISNAGLYHLAGGTGESEWMLFLRASRAVQELVLRPPGNYLVVSHGGLLNRVMQAILGIHPQANFQGARFEFGNTGFTKFSYNHANSFWHMSAANDQAHLELEDNKSTPYTFTILRHGESVGNLEHRWQGQAEFPLTEEGQQQAHVLGKLWKEQAVAFDHVFASPQSRAWETAEIVAGYLGLEIEKHDLLKEIDNGKFSGLKGNEAQEKYPDTPHRDNAYIKIGETGESFWETYLRAGQFLQVLMERPPGNYLIVSHGGTSNLLLISMLGIRLQPFGVMPSFRFGNTGFAKVGYDPEKNQWRVMRVGDEVHLKTLVRSEA